VGECLAGFGLTFRYILLRRCPSCGAARRFPSTSEEMLSGLVQAADGTAIHSAAEKDPILFFTFRGNSARERRTTKSAEADKSPFWVQLRLTT
jgi:hypothetical protein